MIGGLIWTIFSSETVPADSITGTAATGSGAGGSTGFATGSGDFVRVGGRIFEIGGSTERIFGSPLPDSERFERLSSISETVSGFGGGGGGGGGVSATGADAWAGADACGLALLIGGTPVRTEPRGEDGARLVLFEIRSVAG